MWDSVQFHRFDLYGVMTSTDIALPITATLHTTIAGFGDTPTAYNDGVGSFRRSHVGFVPNGLFRSAWIPSGSTDPLLTITSAGLTGGQALIQFVAVLRSTAGAPTAIEGAAEAIAHHVSMPAPDRDADAAKSDACLN